MHIKSITVGEFEVNCLVLWAKAPNALVVDPGANPELILKFLEDQKLSPVLYLFTHGHYDHISAIADVCNVMPAPIACHKDDSKWAFSEINQMLPYYAMPRKPDVVMVDVADGDQRSDAGLNYRVIHTPGHTPGSVCYYFPDSNDLVTGDTLFAGTVGRTDLPGGSPREMQDSLETIAGLPDVTRIYPGHGPASTLLQEKKTNYFMRTGSFN